MLAVFCIWKWIYTVNFFRPCFILPFCICAHLFCSFPLAIFLSNVTGGTARKKDKRFKRYEGENKFSDDTRRHRKKTSQVRQAASSVYCGNDAKPFSVECRCLAVLSLDLWASIRIFYAITGFSITIVVVVIYHTKHCCTTKTARGSDCYCYVVYVLFSFFCVCDFFFLLLSLPLAARFSFVLFILIRLLLKIKT